MTAESSSPDQPRPGLVSHGKSDGKSRPDWANGLKRLYDSVVEEDLPDSFKDLLAQLDSKD